MTTCRGMTKVCNEAPWIRDTLDAWAPYCTGGIHVYCDCCTDETADLCRAHPAVVEVIESNLYDPDRARSDQFNRQHLLMSVKRFLGPDDWIAYFDADEHLLDFPVQALDDPAYTVLMPEWWDVYITPEDVDTPYRERDWVAQEGQYIPLFFRNSPYLNFTWPDQRIMDHPRLNEYPILGRVRHYGLGRSVEDWERKCAYYQQWPEYAEKWVARRGQAIRRDYRSIHGTPLVRYSEFRRTAW